MFKNYLKITLRTIKRQPGYSLINILGLAIGMACCILILLWVQDEFSFDKFHSNYNNLYRTLPTVEDTTYSSNPLALAPIFKEKHPEVLKAARFTGRNWLFRYKDKMFSESGGMVDDDFLKMFSFPLLQGSPETVLADRSSIVLTKRTAEKYFGDEDPIGKSILVSNRNELIVTGVLENLPLNSHLQFDFLASIRLMGARAEQSWSYEAWTYVLLQETTLISEFRKKISGFVMEHDKRTNQKVTLGIQPLAKIHLYSIRGTDPVIYVYIFLSIAIAILLIACINFINLATARANTRAKEIGMRKVIGAEKSDLIKQFIGEALLFSLAAMLLALSLVLLLLPAFNILSGKHLSLNLTGSLSSFLSLVGIILITGLVAGSYPALLLSSYKPVNALKGTLRSGSGGFRLRKILVIGQFTATVILLIGTIIMYKQLNFIKNKELGLNKENVIAISMNSELRRSYDAFKSELQQNPDIINVTSAWNLPTNIGRINPVYWEGKGPEQYTTMNDASVDYDYFETFEMEVIQGRSFSEDFSTDIQGYILNEEAFRMTGLKSPLGKLFSIWEDEGQIIGIVKNFHSRSLHNEIGPIVFTLSQRHGSHSYVFARLSPGNIPATLSFIQKAATKFAPNNPFDYAFIDEDVNRQYTSDRQTGAIYRYFTFLAILISCLGLFGMASFTAEQRTKEIGIRKVLGASIPNIINQITKEFLVLLAIANLLAWPAAYFLMTRMLNNYAYRTNIPFWAFLAAGTAAVLLALATVSLKILKAACADPVDSLRYE